MYKNEDGDVFYLNLSSTQVPRLERGRREVYVPNTLRSFLSSPAAPSEATPLRGRCAAKYSVTLLEASVPSNSTPLRAVRAPIRTSVSVPRRGNRLFLKDIISEAVAAVSCLKCSDGSEEKDRTFASSAIEQHD